MTIKQRAWRVRCWFRGYHLYYWGDGSGRTAAFRYDCSGVCIDCGTVGTGIMGYGE